MQITYDYTIRYIVGNVVFIAAFVAVAGFIIVKFVKYLNEN
jgi:hypothetical protein